ncbi:hypothetical protein CLAIMM_03572 isoform 2 [Cladophialophora immunda]|nr:hypothetical protein CLAIMM_03572 isoform 2 [Cladophialophora immunda]
MMAIPSAPPPACYPYSLPSALPQANNHSAGSTAAPGATTSTNVIHCFRKRPLRGMTKSVKGTAAVIAFGVTVTSIAVIAWTKRGLDIGKKSLELAAWTAKKDFLEFCQTQLQAAQPLSAECNSTLTSVLHAPPMWKRFLGVIVIATQNQTLRDRISTDDSLSVQDAVGLTIKRALIVLCTVASIVMLARRRSANSHDQRRCLTVEHVCDLHAIETSSAAVDESAVTVANPTRATATGRSTTNNGLPRRRA